MSAFPLTPMSLPTSRAGIPRSSTVPVGLSPTGRLAQMRESRASLGRTRAEPGLEQQQQQQRCCSYVPRHTGSGGGGGGESVGSDSCCSSPPGSSCYSSQRSSPAPAHAQAPMPSPQPAHPPGSAQPYHHQHFHQHHHPHSSSSSSLSFLLLEEEEEEEEPETNVDTGCAVVASTRVERPAAVGASALETLARELSRCLPDPHAPSLGIAKTWAPGSPAGADQRSEVTAVSPGECRSPGVDLRTTEPQEARTTEERTVVVESGPPQGQNHTQQADEFFI